MKNKAAQIDANLNAGANIAPTGDVQSKSVGNSPRSRKRKVSEVQGIKKIVKSTIDNINNGLRG